MNLDLVVRQGSNPWAPNQHASDLEVWHYNDVPTLGTFTLGDDTVLFMLVDEPSDRSTTWCYVDLLPGVTESLGDVTFDTYEDMSAFAERQYAGREAVFARAVSYELRQWGPVHVEKHVLSAAVSFLHNVAGQLERDLADLQLQDRSGGAGLLLHAHAQTVLSMTGDQEPTAVDPAEWDDVDEVSDRIEVLEAAAS